MKLYPPIKNALGTSETMSSRRSERLDQIDSHSFDLNAYEYMLLNQRFGSLILAQHLRESKESFIDFKLNNPIFDTQRREESKEVIVGKKRENVHFSVQCQSQREESKELIDNSKGAYSSDLAQLPPKTSLSDYEISQAEYVANQERFNIYTGFPIDAAMHRRDFNLCQSQGRKLVEQYDIRRLRKQRQKIAYEFSSELSKDIRTNHTKIVAQTRSIDYGKKSINEVRDKRNDKRIMELGTTRTKSQEETDISREKLREDLSIVRYRTHSSRAFLARHYLDPSHDYQKWKERNEDITASAMIRKIRRPNLDTNQLEEIKTEIDSNVPPGTSIASKSTAFDPFPSIVCENYSLDDETWPVFAFSFVEKPADISNDEISERDTANVPPEAVTIPSGEEAEANIDSLDDNLELNRNETFVCALICRSKSFEKDFCRKSTSFDQSTRSTSSYGTPTTPTSKVNRIISKSQEAFEKKRSRRGLISSLSKPKVANKEWLRASIESDGDVLRKRDKKMKEWLNVGNKSADAIVDGLPRGGTMETVFYDTRQKNFEDQ